MANLIVGDIHGCFAEFESLLKKAEFNPAHDTLWLVGDLVARGAHSLETLRYIYSISDSVKIVLGNHDIHLLAIYAGISKSKPKDHLEPLLNAPDCDRLINWLRRQPLIQVDYKLKLVMVHAGITPQWDISTAVQCASEVHAILSSDSYPLFLDAMYGDKPDYWRDDLSGLNRLRYITNVLTRIRFCYPDGRLDLSCKESPEHAPSPLIPWFNLNGSIKEHYSIVFGHWAALRGKKTPQNIYALDTGCCWGGKLTLLRWEDKHYFRQSADKK